MKTEPVGPFHVAGVSGLKPGIRVGERDEVRWEGEWAGPFSTFEEAEHSLAQCESGDPAIALCIWDQGGRTIYLPVRSRRSGGTTYATYGGMHVLPPPPECFVCRRPLEIGEQVLVVVVDGVPVPRHVDCLPRGESA